MDEVNNTIYCNNINEKVKVDELKKALHAVFAQFGEILDVIAMSTLKMRGQAFVVFKEQASAKEALESMQGFPFFNKPMRIAWCKSKSDTIAKLDGTYVPRDKAAKRKAEEKERKERAKKQREEAKAAAVEESKRPHTMPGMTMSDGLPPSAHLPPVDPNENKVLPHNVLFVENLPDNVNDMMLRMLFQQFPGFQDVRLVPGRTGIAFIDFDNQVQAATAMNSLQNFKITPTNLMKISFAKR